MTREEEEAIDWNLCTFEGNQIRQDREFLAYPFWKKLEVVDELGRFAEEWVEKARLRRERERDLVAP